MKTDEWNEESAAVLRLSLVRGIGPATTRKLLEVFDSARRVWEASSEQLAACLEPDPLKCLRTGADERAMERALRWREIEGHHLITWNDVRYPALLREIPDPPLVLYAKGDPERLQRPSVAIVGSRNATAQGRTDAFEFASALSSAGFCIVSGMALGIDACAHQGGLAGRGSSIAVLGTGIETIYPQANARLALRLEREGCIVSEFDLGTPPLKGNFPVRNRLISGLSRGALVVEAALESGSLVTARRALDQNRDVFAMPGSIHSPLAKGCHALIRQGAKLTECVEDVLVELGATSPAEDRATQRVENADPLLDVMGFAPISLEQLAERSGLGVARIAESLSRLEIEGNVAILAGGLFQRMSHASASRQGGGRRGRAL